MPNLAYHEKAIEQKYPMREGRQREMCRRKAELLESQAFRVLPLIATYGFNSFGLIASEVTAHMLIEETLFRGIQWGMLTAH